MKGKIMPKVTLTLKRPARKKGGDRYETVLPNGERWIVYFPQSISRPEGTPKKMITISID